MTTTKSTRRAFTTALLLFSLSIVHASGTLTVVGIDGQEAARYDVTSLARIDLGTADSIRFVMSDGTSHAFAVSSVPRLSFTSVTTDITMPETAVKADRLRVWAGQNTVYVSGAEEGAAIGVFTISGVRIGAGKAGNGTTSIDVTTLPEGVYVVKAGRQAAKFIKR